MGFNQIDINAISTARKCGFIFDVIDTKPHIQKKINKVQPPLTISCSEPDKVLFAALEALERRDGAAASIWLDVPMKQMPPYIGRALRGNNFALHLVVTHMNTCSHLPGISLAESLKDALSESGTGNPFQGQVWHPFTGEMVHRSALTD